MLVAMGFEDLASVVNGKQDNETGMKLFGKHFTKDEILVSWLVEGGICSAHAEFYQNKKVCHELGQF